MKRSHLLWMAVLVCVAVSAHAQAPAPAAQAPATANASDVRAEYLTILNDAGNKLVRLAEAVPAEKYTWRPAEGTRSVSELFLHVAAGNFGIASRRLGATVPEGVNLQGLEKSTTDKAQVIELLKKSVDTARQAATSVPPADLEKTSRWFDGSQVTQRYIMFFLATHNHEHLGQAIAYVRMNGITPPWTEEQMQRQQQAPAKRPPSE